MPLTSTTPQRVLVGLLASNQKGRTLECLDSLAATQGAEYEVFLVDNGSDERIADATAGYDFVQTDRRSENLGCAGGRNIIIRHFLQNGTWPYLFFLDNDALVEPGTIRALIETASAHMRDERRIGGVGPHVVSEQDHQQLWCAGGARIDWERGWFVDGGQGQARDDAFVEARPLDTLTGGFMFVTREAVQATGFFTEPYFIYLEDTEWCWRMKLQGFELWSAPRAVCRHYGSSSMGALSPLFHYYRVRNRLWFFSSFTPGAGVRLKSAIIRHVLWHSFCLEARAGRWRGALAVLRGIATGLFPPHGVRRAASAERHLAR
ncbi:MAG: glycosyltransferase family 2 protein [Verrucomicrobia bacterium]|nr:glycosyltransferase family 2 protein [Verrucomicrobiota bacterium]MDA1085405.1 glycosyltransferase family 2 protein [Verrucomicrobiota bacterium]